MADSKYVASLVGPIVVATTGSELANPRLWDDITAPATYQSGLLLFVGGLAIVRAHNVWAAGWPVVLTFVGWLGLVAGLCRMFFTSLAQQGAPAIALPLEIGLLAIGVFLTFKGYSR